MNFHINKRTDSGEMVHVPLKRDWFIQSSNYNTFHDQKRRYYTNFEPGFANCYVFKKLMDHHHNYFNIPVDTTTISIINKNFYTAETVDKCPTGQGIHTDGSIYSTFIVLEKDNLRGPETIFYLPDS